jgi:ligand-binding SRPBCC domain-containing protein
MRHEHVFEQVDEDLTRMTDRMSFDAPLGSVGGLVARWVLAPCLRGLVVQRAEHVRQVVEAARR